MSICLLLCLSLSVGIYINFTFRMLKKNDNFQTCIHRMSPFTIKFIDQILSLIIIAFVFPSVAFIFCLIKKLYDISILCAIVLICNSAI